MAKQNPDLFLIKMGDGADPVVYSTMCGLNSRSLTIGGDSIDVSTVDCQGGGGNAWQENAHGLRNMSVSGNGFFENKAQATQMIDKKMTGDGVEDFQVVAPGLGTFEGKFLIGDMEYGGELNGGAVTYGVSLTSSGAITFTAEV